MFKTEDCRYGYTEAFKIAHARKTYLCFNLVACLVIISFIVCNSKLVFLLKNKVKAHVT